MLHGHGDDTYNFAGELRGNFSSNVFPYGMDKELVAFLKEKIATLKTYPEPLGQPLAVALAEQHGVAAENILPTGGATEAFYLVAELFAGQDATILIPSFAEYEDACRKYGHSIRYVQNTTPLEEAAQGADTFWLCNPNNPDGKQFDENEIYRCIEKYPQTAFIIDEAYVDFCPEAKSLLKMIEKYQNLIVIRSMTKKYVIPGLRLGYLVANEKLILRLQKKLMPWRLGQLTVAVGCYLAKQKTTHFIQYKNELLIESKRVQQEISKIQGFEIQPSETNYFLMFCPCKAAEMKEYLLNEHALLVRDASNFRNLPENAIRISTQTPEKNELLINGLKIWSMKFMQ